MRQRGGGLLTKSKAVCDQVLIQLRGTRFSLNSCSDYDKRFLGIDKATIAFIGKIGGWLIICGLHDGFVLYESRMCSALGSGISWLKAQGSLLNLRK